MCLSQEQKDKLKAYLKGLARQEKLIILLYYSENMSAEEIGEILYIPTSQVNEMHFSLIRGMQSACWS